MKRQPYTLSNVVVERDNDTILIKSDNVFSEKSELFMGDVPIKSNINIKVGESNSGNFKLILPKSKLPKYFVIRSKKYTSNVFAERVLPLENAINVRDMGGYESNDGRTLKWGLLYRGDQLTNLSEDDCNILANFNISTIIDYRSAHERQYHPNKLIPTVVQQYYCDPQSSFSEVSADVVDLKGENEKLVNALESGAIPKRYINDKGRNVIESYEDMVTSSKAQIAYGRALRAMVRCESLPILHHCRGGKDRTGFSSMLFMLLLNIKDEEIVRDYMITKTVRQKRNKMKYDLYHELVERKDYLDYLMAMIDTREIYIMSAIKKIREIFGTSDNYFQQHFGLSMEQIETARNFYLEEGK